MGVLLRKVPACRDLDASVLHFRERGVGCAFRFWRIGTQIGEEADGQAVCPAVQGGRPHAASGGDPADIYGVNVVLPQPIEERDPALGMTLEARVGRRVLALPEDGIGDSADVDGLIELLGWNSAPCVSAMQ